MIIKYGLEPVLMQRKWFWEPYLNKNASKDGKLYHWSGSGQEYKWWKIIENLKSKKKGGKFNNITGVPL